MRAPDLIMVGAFPPPVGGASKNNLLLLEELRARGVIVEAINVGASTLSHRRSARFHIERIRRNVSCLLRLVQGAGRGPRLYTVPDGGLGAWYSMAHLMLATALPIKHVVIHHRTFRYVDDFSRPVSVLTGVTRKRATHVFLSPEMANRFQALYGPVASQIAGNARFVVDEAKSTAQPRAPGPLRIGHLSNLCREKGFFDVADAYEAFMASGHEAELHLAGPVVEPEVAHRLTSLKETYGARVQHVGPVSGAMKTDFYRALDVFLFPTRFDQEASPNVVYEALAAGVPVIATGRGCLPEMVHGLRGVIADPVEKFPERVLAYLADLSLDPAPALERRVTIKADIAADSDTANAQYEALLNLLLGR